MRHSCFAILMIDEGIVASASYFANISLYIQKFIAAQQSQVFAF